MLWDSFFGLGLNASTYPVTDTNSTGIQGIDCWWFLLIRRNNSDAESKGKERGMLLQDRQKESQWRGGWVGAAPRPEFSSYDVHY